MSSALTPRPGDVIVAGAAALVALLYTALAGADPSPALRVEALLSWLLVAALLFWRSRVRVAAVAVLVLLSCWALNWSVALPGNLGVTPWLLTAPMVVWSTTRHLPDRRWWGRGVLLATLAGSLLSPAMWRVTLDGPVYRTGGDWAVFLLVHWLILICAHLLALRQVARDQARRQHLDAAVRERELRLRAGREEERILIAGEIHDVLAHSLTLIKVNANAGLRLGARDPRTMTGYLEDIHTVSSQALGQVRDIVTALRDDARELRPAPQLSDVPRIVDEFTRAGLEVTTDLPEHLDRWSAEIPVINQLAVVRIITEGLTNALRHQGHGTEARVTLTVDDDVEVLVDSTRNGEPPPEPGNPGTQDGTGTGTGLVALAERTRALGGSFHAEGHAGGFHLRGRIPLTLRGGGERQ